MMCLGKHQARTPRFPNPIKCTTDSSYHSLLLTLVDYGVQLQMVLPVIQCCEWLNESELQIFLGETDVYVKNSTVTLSAN